MPNSTHTPPVRDSSRNFASFTATLFSFPPPKSEQLQAALQSRLQEKVRRKSSATVLQSFSRRRKSTLAPGRLSDIQAFQAQQPGENREPVIRESRTRWM